MGLKVAGIPQSIEAYCDDFNVLTNIMSDILVVDLAVREFEAVSRAIRSGGKKSNVIGFGTWKNRLDWPLDYLKIVKLFDIFVMDSFRSLIKKN